MSNLSETSGVFIVAQTPFDDIGRVDLDSIETLTDFYFAHGATGLTVLGVAGEASKLTTEEAIDVATTFIRRAAGKPVVVGTSNPNIALLDALTRKVMDAGAAAVMIAPPAGLKSDEDIFSYFSAVFARIGNTPVVLQDFPTSSQVWMSVPCIARLIEAFPQIAIIKEEDLPSIPKITRLRQEVKRPVSIMTGNNGVYLPQEMARGINGPMSGFSYPEMLSAVYRLMRDGNAASAHDIFDMYLPLLNYENQGQFGVAARKEVLRRRGAIRHANMRRPGPALTNQELGEIDLLVRRIETARAERAVSASTTCK